MEQRAAIKFCFKLKKTASETLELLQTAYGNECLSRSKVFEWYARFKAGRESLADDPREGCPSTSTTDGNIERVRVAVSSNPRATVEMLADELHISEGSVHTILTEKLGKNLLHDNAPAHTAILVAQFLAKRKVTVITHPPYSPDLAPADFFLFPKLKNAMKGDRFDDVPDIQRNVTRIMNSIPAEQFKRAFRHLYERSKICVEREGLYVEN